MKALVGRTYVPHDSNLGMSEESLGHDLGGPKFVLSNKNVDVRGVLGQV